MFSSYEQTLTFIDINVFKLNTCRSTIYIFSHELHSIAIVPNAYLVSVDDAYRYIRPFDTLRPDQPQSLLESPSPDSARPS